MSTRRIAIIAASLVCLCIGGLTPARGVVQPEDEPSTLAQADAAFAQQDYERAVVLFRQANQEGIDFQPLHYRLGYALHVLGRIEEALPHHLIGAGSTGGAMRSACLYNAACAAARLGKTDDALGYFQQAIDAGFVNTQLAGSDTDLDAIRSDPRFRGLIDGIGVRATLHQQLDFLLGTWEWRDPDGTALATASFTRPSPSASSIVTTFVGGNGSYVIVGMISPVSEDRSWEWVEADGIGTTIKRRGVANGQAITFEGAMAGPTGTIAHMRLARSLEPDGRLRERAEASWDDGHTWNLHHEAYFIRATPTPPTPPAPADEGD